jgi:hypothetical protein
MSFEEKVPLQAVSSILTHYSPVQAYSVIICLAVLVYSCFQPTEKGEKVNENN